MRPNHLKQLQREKRTAINAWVSMGSGYLAEVLGHSGFDAVTVDLQHAPMGFDMAVHLLQAISATPAVPLARCAGSTLAEINKLLDAGAYGIICPLIDSVDEAAFFACSASWGLWSEAMEAGKVAVPTAALPPALLDPKAGETAADWGIYLIDSDEALELHKAVERQLAPELARVLAGDAKAARSWFTRLGTCKVPD